MNKDKLERIASEKSSPCVTISMNTHRLSPENLEDHFILETLLHEARERVVKEFDKQSTSILLENLNSLTTEIDFDQNLESLHLFVSSSTKEIIKSSWPISRNSVHVSEYFVVKPLIKDFNRLEEYLILVLSQSGVRLFNAINEIITCELKNEDFPFAKNPHFLTNQKKMSDGKKVDNIAREFFNTIDKAVVRVYNKTEMRCVVFCTADNYSLLMQVADRPSIYYGYIRINYNNTSKITLAKDAWQIVNSIRKQGRAADIKEMQEASGQGKVITDLTDIFRAAKEGRGDLLIVHDDFHQSVKMTGEFSFDLVDDTCLPGITDDITSDIAWEVISKKGRAIFTNQKEFESLGEIALKTRY